MSFGSESKLLLLGRANAGKSSMKSVIFADSNPVDTMTLSATHNIDHRRISLLGDFGVGLWDCGGQDVYLDSYFHGSRELVFQNVCVLIFVVECRVEEDADTRQGDVWESVMLDLEYLKKSIEALSQTSPNAKAFVLVHKLDLIPADRQAKALAAYMRLIRSAVPCTTILPDDHIIGTSIWNETLYQAWSVIARALIPHVDRIQSMLSKLATVLHAQDLILLEKRTFLTIAHATPHITLNYGRDKKESQLTAASFERLSNVIKQLKITCNRVGGNFQTIQVNLTHSSVLIERFTNNLYIVIVLPHRDANLGAVMLNLDLASSTFQELEKLQEAKVVHDEMPSEGKLEV